MGDAHGDPDNAGDSERKESGKGACDGNSQSDDSPDRKKVSAKEKRELKLDED